jgi:hypothetical protein
MNWLRFHVGVPNVRTAHRPGLFVYRLPLGPIFPQLLQNEGLAVVCQAIPAATRHRSGSF